MKAYFIDNTNLKEFCIWGNYDKDTGKCLGWEFGTEGYQSAKTYLVKAGFELTLITRENYEEVW